LTCKSRLKNNLEWSIANVYILIKSIVYSTDISLSRVD
jgi:hypothetical protein